MSNRMHILLVSEDRTELRRISRFLQVCGYCVTACADREAATNLVQRERFDALVADGSVVGEQLSAPLLRGLRAQKGFTYCLLHCSPPSPLEVVNLFQAGWDDLLASPVVHGELLARLRVGARVVEFERRRSRQQQLDPHNLLPNRGAWLQQLRTQYSLADGGVLGTLVLVELAPFPDAEKVTALAKDIAVTAEGCEGPASWNHSSVAFFFPHLTETEALAWGTRTLAGGFQGAMDETSSFHEPRRWNIGVATVTHQTGWDAASQAAESAVQMARDSGGGIAMSATQAAEEQLAWGTLAGDGKLFETSTAGDVMIPCPLLLSADDTPQKALALLRQTELTAIPVVDRQGNYLGAVTLEQLTAAVAPNAHPRQSGSLRLLRHLVYQPPRFEEHTSLSVLVEFFASDSSPFAIVLRQRQPIGLVDCQSLATLNTPPTWDELGPTSEPHTGSRYLLLAEGN